MWHLAAVFVLEVNLISKVWMEVFQWRIQNDSFIDGFMGEEHHKNDYISVFHSWLHAHICTFHTPKFLRRFCFCPLVSLLLCLNPFAANILSHWCISLCPAAEVSAVLRLDARVVGQTRWAPISQLSWDQTFCLQLERVSEIGWMCLITMQNHCRENLKEAEKRYESREYQKKKTAISLRRKMCSKKKKKKKLTVNRIPPRI